MDVREELAMRGVLTLELLDTSGTLLERRRVNHLITLRGKQMLAYLMLALWPLPTAWAIVVGTGTNEPKDDDSALQTPVDRAEIASTGRNASRYAPQKDAKGFVRVTVSASLPARTEGSTQPLTEAGVEITLGKDTKVLFNRVTFAEVNRSTNMVLNLSWEISF